MRLLPIGLVLLVGCTNGTSSSTDAGPDAGDAGDVDAGTVDGGLSPIRADCVSHDAGLADTCWEEWLKETQAPDFTPVSRGAKGAGPWPVTDLVTLGNADGITEGISAAGVDTDENQYAVSRGALFVRRVGEAKFARYDRNTNGLRDYPLLSVAGAKGGVAYVGYEGVFGADPNTETNEVRKSGDLARITLVSGGIEAKSYDTHNSNVPISGKFDHTRSLFDIVIPRRGPAAGEVYLATEHGIVRYTGELYADHLHIATDVNGSQRFGASKAITVTDDGTVWYGNDFQFGGKPWRPRLYEWYFESPWLYPSSAYGGAADRDYYEGIGVDSTGDVWVGARTHGLVHLDIAANRRSAKIDRLSVPDTAINDLVVDLDDSVWLATDGGVYRRDPTTGAWTRVAGIGAGVNKLFLDDLVEPRAIYISSRGGLSVYRGK